MITRWQPCLRYQFRGFQSVGRQFHAVAGLFQHASDKFANADGVVRHHDQPFLYNAIDGLRGNGSREPRLPNPGAKTRAALARSCASVRRSVGSRSDQTVQIHQQDQAAVGRDGGAREQFHAAEVFAEILDDDFVFAEHLFDHHADLSIAATLTITMWK